MGRWIEGALRARPFLALLLGATLLGFALAALGGAGPTAPLGPIGWGAVYGLPALAGGVMAWLIAPRPPE